MDNKCLVTAVDTSAPFCSACPRSHPGSSHWSHTTRLEPKGTSALVDPRASDAEAFRPAAHALRVGDLVFTSFDTDSSEEYEKYGTRPAGRYVSRCEIPADFFNEGQYVLGINASSYRVKRYFQDDHALTFSIDSMGAPGKQWPQNRLGLIRPRLNWQIEEQFE